MTKPDILISREQLSYGKYTRWAKDLSTAEVYGLLWLIGEHFGRQSALDFDYKSETYPGNRRKVAAGAALADFNRHPMTVDQVRAYMIESTKP